MNLDITFCLNGNDCKFKNTCKRFVNRKYLKDGELRTYSRFFDKNSSCTMLLPIEKKKEVKKGVRKIWSLRKRK